MSDMRRGFLALVGSAAVSGCVLIRKAVAAPTLVLPSPIEIIAKEPSPMHVLLEVKSQVPADVFDNWLGYGMRLARHYHGRGEDEMDRVWTAAIAKHGSIIAAVEAGAV